MTINHDIVPGMNHPPDKHRLNTTDTRIATIASLGILGVASIGTYLAAFTSVSLLTGTGTVWAGVALCVVALVAAVVWSVMSETKWLWIVCAALLIVAGSSAIYDEQQLNHQRQQIQQIFNDMPTALPAGHHYGWDKGRGNPHRVPPCSVVFHLGCASIDPPPSGPFVGVPHFPGLS
jgi:hypothetical protein